MNHSSRKKFNVVVVADPLCVTSESLVEHLVSPQFPLLPPTSCQVGYLLPSVLQTDCTNSLTATLAIASPKMGKLPHSISSGSQYT